VKKLEKHTKEAAKHLRVSQTSNHMALVDPHLGAKWAFEKRDILITPIKILAKFFTNFGTRFFGILSLKKKHQ